MSQQTFIEIPTARLDALHRDLDEVLAPRPGLVEQAIIHALSTGALSRDELITTVGIELKQLMPPLVGLIDRRVVKAYARGEMVFYRLGEV